MSSPSSTNASAISWQDEDLDRAEQHYLEALRQYDLGYGLRNGHYPGINKATLLLLLAALGWQRRQDVRCDVYLQKGGRPRTSC